MRGRALLVEALGCKLMTLNSVLDGDFPGRGPEPTPDTLKDLSFAVKSVGADLGVAYDGDGDRSMFCDEDGRVLWGDQSGCLIADYLLERNPHATVVASVSSSQRPAAHPRPARARPAHAHQRPHAQGQAQNGGRQEEGPRQDMIIRTKDK